MSDLTLTKICFRNGIWQGRLSGTEADSQPTIEVLYLDQPVDGVKIAPGETGTDWELHIPVPQHAIADGVQTFLICTGDGQTLGSFAFNAGDTIPDELRVDVELLRVELDMLKRAFRRHCLQTA